MASHTTTDAPRQLHNTMVGTNVLLLCPKGERKQPPTQVTDSTDHTKYIARAALPGGGFSPLFLSRGMLR